MELRVMLFYQNEGSDLFFQILVMTPNPYIMY